MKKVKEVIGLETKVIDNTKSLTSSDDTSYLRRHAGMETVQTSMKGIMTENDKAPERKKLLGE